MKEIEFFEVIPSTEKDYIWCSELETVGDRVGQIIILPYPQILFEEAEKLSEKKRGSGGYGSTGK